jgi:hypothetical protein
MDTLAQFVTDLFEALGFPPAEYLSPEDAVRAVRRSLAFYDLDLGQSNQNQVVSKSAEFSFTTREKSLSNVRGVPLWLERKVGSAPNEGWPMVHAGNLAAVEDAWGRGDERCAFYNGEKNALVVRLSYLPSAAQKFRLWYDPNPSLSVTLADPVLLTPTFYPMFTARAVLDAVPVMLLHAAKCAEEGNPPSSLTLTAWDIAGNRAEQVLDDYKPIWRQHKLGSRGAARGRNRRPVLARSGRGF